LASRQRENLAGIAIVYLLQVKHWWMRSEGWEAMDAEYQKAFLLGKCHCKQPFHIEHTHQRQSPRPEKCIKNQFNALQTQVQIT
jgi:hypothetical protein